ncbi:MULTISPECIES: hypothetical protein [Actinomadura]|uniref:Uncharacterized protein n=1 Tax=Actinomadura yumaensis TaxID=111807 RepID=A0ABW2CUD7_9ACTN|nr:hypothetical protein [Actinomadura sp. J1-007]MWK33217.1 hypothetical protein [Actinomadura sp. J1-007]
MTMTQHGGRAQHDGTNQRGAAQHGGVQRGGAAQHGGAGQHSGAPQHGGPAQHGGAMDSLRELQAAYRVQLAQLATERDEARRAARRAKAEADVARADLASLKSRVHELLTAASMHLPALEAPEAAPGRPALTEARSEDAAPIRAA